MSKAETIFNKFATLGMTMLNRASGAAKGLSREEKYKRLLLARRIKQDELLAGATNANSFIQETGDVGVNIFSRLDPDSFGIKRIVKNPFNVHK